MVCSFALLIWEGSLFSLKIFASHMLKNRNMKTIEYKLVGLVRVMEYFQSITFRTSIGTGLDR